MNVHQSKHCCGVYLVSGKIVDYAGQRRFSSHGHSHVADWFSKLGHICKMTWAKRYLAMGVSAADCHKAANVKGICTGILTFTQMRLTKVFGISRDNLSFDRSSKPKHSGVYKIDVTVLCKLFYSLCGGNKPFIRCVLSFWFGFSQFLCCSAGCGSS
jgi:hypothetical protein